ncbi:hypothetical protein TNCV_2072711 [Trichonephila clavipes]|nr:hypothetical protein TNCV_2072711 [Trichonephila clavipes]
MALQDRQKFQWPPFSTDLSPVEHVWQSLDSSNQSLVESSTVKTIRAQFQRAAPIYSLHMALSPKIHLRIVILIDFYSNFQKHLYGPQLAKNGCQVTMVAKNYTNLALSPTFCQVFIESSL